MVAPVSPPWLSPSDWGSLTLRLVVAAVLGGVIGWNRQVTGKAAGLRTHILVSLGAALFIIIPMELGASATDAVSRAIQGVATGIGFLGAGEIVHFSRTDASGKPKVKGLTSAAAIWVTAALGMVTAAGLWHVSLIATVITLATLSGGKWLERFIPVRPEDEG